VGEPLKRIYKASQEKKRIFLPGCRFGFVFFTSPHPNLYFSNQLTCVIASCWLLLFLLFVCLCLLHGRNQSAVTTTIYASSSALMKHNTHSSVEEVDRPISVQVW